MSLKEKKNRLMNTRQAANYIGVSIQTMQRWREAAYGPEFYWTQRDPFSTRKNPMAAYYYRVQDLDDFINKRMSDESPIKKIGDV